MPPGDQVWKSEALGRQFLEGVRGAIPLADVQLELMLRIARRFAPRVSRVLDLGCGDGILGRALLAEYPQASAVFLDFSETMLAAAKARLATTTSQATFVLQDYGQPEWLDAVRAGRPFDLVVSGFSIHHQPDTRKQAIYREIYDLLSGGGLFLNLEHVASTSPAVEGLFDEYFIDALCRHHAQGDSGRTPAQIAQEYYHRPDKAANLLTRVETQCEWLEAIGFEHVDCFFKVFELALFGGIKPS